MSFKELIKKYSKEDVRFTKHAKEKLFEFSFTENFIAEKLFDVAKLVYEEYHEEKKTCKLIYEHSKDYLLAIVVALNEKIRIVTVYKTSKKIQKLINQRGIVHIWKVFKTEK